MPDNCCVLLCCKSGYRVGLDGGYITYHSLPSTDPRKRKVFFNTCCFYTLTVALIVCFDLLLLLFIRPIG